MTSPIELTTTVRQKKEPAGTLTFEALQPDRFPAYVVGREAARLGGTAPARFNAANEVAVQLFLEERITFGRIRVIDEGPDLLYGRNATG